MEEAAKTRFKSFLLSGLEVARLMPGKAHAEVSELAVSCFTENLHAMAWPDAILPHDTVSLIPIGEDPLKDLSVVSDVIYTLIIL